jgi:hypothetical protein
MMAEMVPTGFWVNAETFELIPAISQNFPGIYLPKIDNPIDSIAFENEI